MEAEEKLAGGVFGALGFGVLEAVEVVLRGQFFPEGGGEVGHFLDRFDAFVPDPVEDLSGAVGFLVEDGELFGELDFVEAVEADRHDGGGDQARAGACQVCCWKASSTGVSPR